MKNSEEETYRDIVSTVDEVGKRKWIYAHKPSGTLYNYRKYLSYVYLVLLVIVPFIKMNGNPLFLFDLVHGKFIVFGKLFLPQDFILFGLAMLTFLLFIIVFTLAYGRIFCGWVCPQTIFMEMVFRRIEYFIEGSASQQMRVNKGAWTTEILLKKILKHVIFFIVSFLIANIFLSYVIGVDALFQIISEPVKNHLAGFLAILLFSVVFYIVFAHVRELVCTVVCPYGRLQSVLLDKNSIVVAYNYLRGEPRARESRSRIDTAGDCIDCGLCVQVCPTGIDIRNGTQMECTNCTACIDACNLMMKKTGRAQDLILFTSENNIKESSRPKFTYRMAIYSFFLLVLLALMSFLLLERKSLDITVMRVSGQILQTNQDGTISNLYRMKIVNTSAVPQVINFHIDVPSAELLFIGNQLDTIKVGHSSEEMFFIKRLKKDIKNRKEDIGLSVSGNGKLLYQKKIAFIGFN